MHSAAIQVECLTHRASYVPTTTIQQENHMAFFDFKHSSSSSDNALTTDTPNFRAIAVTIFERLSLDVETTINEISSVPYSDGAACLHYVVDACVDALKSTMPIFLDEVTECLADLTRGEIKSVVIEIKELRLQYALSKAVNYFLHIQQARSMAVPLQNRLEFLFRSISEKAENKFRPSFRISSLLSNELILNVSLGDAESVTLTDSQLTVKLTVQPFLEFTANCNFSAALRRASVCKVSIERCAYRSRNDAKATGIVGEVSFRACIVSLQDKYNKNEERCNASINKNSLPILREATAFQQNAYPAQPKSSIDLFTSNEYGCSSVNISTVVPVYSAKHGGTQIEVCIDLFLS